MDRNDDIKELRLRVSSLRLAVICFTCALMTVLVAWNISLLAAIPESKKIVSDMLGSIEKAPRLIKNIFAYYDVGGIFGPGKWILWVPLASILAFIFKRSSKLIIVLVTLVMAFLALHALTISYANRSMYLQIIQGINSL